MNEKLARDLIQKYVDGWKQNDLQKIMACLADDCKIIESHGVSYAGQTQVSAWFKVWLAANSKVTKWDIQSFYFVPEKNTACFEWDFSCISNGIRYDLPGISIVKFSDQKISFIHEYRMTKPAYNWQGDALKSE